jgi:Cu/Ag efflux pump CusA
MGYCYSTIRLGYRFYARDPVPVDAIPDIGDNQQIVFTEWPGRSPQDIEDQITYPLTTQLLGLPGVRTVRSNSMFGFSSINVIFEDDVEFYWSRSRILEKLNRSPGRNPSGGCTAGLGPGCHRHSDRFSGIRLRGTILTAIQQADGTRMSCAPFRIIRFAGTFWRERCG